MEAGMAGARGWFWMSLLAAGLAASTARATDAAGTGERPAGLTMAAAPSRAGSDGAAILIAPVLRLLAVFGVPVQDPAPLPNSEALERNEGWRALEIPVRDEGLGVYLEVKGRVEFDSGTIQLADGSASTIAMHGVSRGNGLYQLADFGGTRTVEAVTLHVRARSAQAAVGVRLGR
jgi:hypothetical protein